MTHTARVFHCMSFGTQSNANHLFLPSSYDVERRRRFAILRSHCTIKQTRTNRNIKESSTVFPRYDSHTKVLVCASFGTQLTGKHLVLVEFVRHRAVASFYHPSITPHKERSSPTVNCVSEMTHTTWVVLMLCSGTFLFASFDTVKCESQVLAEFVRRTTTHM